MLGDRVVDAERVDVPVLVDREVVVEFASVVEDESSPDILESDVMTGPGPMMMLIPVLEGAICGIDSTVWTPSSKLEVTTGPGPI